MEIIFQRHINKNYMIIVGEEKQLEIPYQYFMIENNPFDSLLAVQIQQKDSHLEYYYDISSKQSLMRMFEQRKLGEQEIKGVILGLGKAIKECKRFLLNPNHLYIHPEYIYMKWEDNSIYFCYTRQQETDIKESIKELIYFLMKRTDHEDSRAVFITYELFRCIMETDYTMDDLLQVLHRKEEKREIHCNIEYGEDSQREYNQKGYREEGYYSIQSKDTNTNHVESDNFQYSYMTYDERENDGKERYVLDGKIKEVFIGFIIIDIIFGIFLSRVVGGTTGVIVCGVLLLIGGSVFYTKKKKQNNVAYSGIHNGLYSSQHSGIHSNQNSNQHSSMNSSKHSSMNSNQHSNLHSNLQSNLNSTKNRKEGRIEYSKQLQKQIPNNLDEAYYSTYEEKEEVEFDQYNKIQPNVYGQTTVLSESSISHRLIYAGGQYEDEYKTKKEQQEIVLHHFPFLLGRGERECDGVVYSEKVSRIHFQIEEKEGVFFGMDVNSTNGSWINNEPLTPNIPYQIYRNDRIRIADLEYIFQ